MSFMKFMESQYNQENRGYRKGFSYQSPFLGTGTSGASLERNKKYSFSSLPVFFFPVFNKSRKEPESIQKWCKNTIFSEVVNGKPSPIYQIYLRLVQETSTVNQVAQMVKEEVGTCVMLLDNKGLRIMPSESTKGQNPEPESILTKCQSSGLGWNKNFPDLEKGIALHTIPSHSDEQPIAKKRQKQWVEFV